jgi:hypothetical protein
MAATQLKPVEQRLHGLLGRNAGGHSLLVAPCFAELAEAKLVRAFGLGGEAAHEAAFVKLDSR